MNILYLRVNLQFLSLLFRVVLLLELYFHKFRICIIYWYLIVFSYNLSLLYPKNHMGQKYRDMSYNKNHNSYIYWIYIRSFPCQSLFYLLGFYFVVNIFYCKYLYVLVILFSFVLCIFLLLSFFTPSLFIKIYIFWRYILECYIFDVNSFAFGC